MVLIKSSVKGQVDCKVQICNEVVTFDSKGIAEVGSKEKANEIVKKWSPLIVIIKGEVKSKIEDPIDGPDESGQEIDLSEKTVDELRDVCKAIDLPSKEWKSLKKSELIEYIEEKIK